MISITFREYRFQRFVAYYLSELNSAKKIVKIILQ